MDASAIAAWFRLFAWAPEDPAWAQQHRAAWAWRKLAKARRWARIIARVPWVRMVAVGNALGYGNCTDASDADLVIVTAPRRVWLTRLVVVGLLRLFRQRPGEHRRDAICPSFFLTMEAMGLEDLQLGYSPSESARGGRVEGRPSTGSSHIGLPPDPYLLFWLTQLTVLSDHDGTYERFWRANERWVWRWLPDARPRAAHPRLSVSSLQAPPPSYVSPSPEWRGSDPSRPERRERGWDARVGDSLERLARRFQERRLPRAVQHLKNRDTRVIVNDRMIKLHTNDRRREYRERWFAML